MKVACKGTIFFHPTYPKGKEFDFWPVDPNVQHLGIPVREEVITFTIEDDFDPRTAEAVALKKELARTRAEFENRQTEILRRINELTAIEGGVE